MVQGLSHGHGRPTLDEDRLTELRELAERHNAWRHQRRGVVLELASRLDGEEGVAELRAGQDEDDTVVVIVTDRRVLIGRRPDPTSAIHVDSVGFEELASVDTGHEVAGLLKLAWPGGGCEVARLSGRDAEVLKAAIAQRIRSPKRAVLQRQRERKPTTELELLDSLRRSGILSDEEAGHVRERVIQQIAVRVSAPEATPHTR